MKNLLFYGNFFFIITNFCMNFKRDNDYSNDPFYIFYQKLSKIDISKDAKIEDAINLFKDYYKELIEKENKNTEAVKEGMTSNLQKLEELRSYPLSKLTWHGLAIRIKDCAYSEKTKKFLKSNKNIQKKINDEYEILSAYAKKKHCAIDKNFFIFLRLIPLGRDDKEINHEFESSDFDYLKNLLPNIFHDINKAKKLLNNNDCEKDETDYQSFLDFQNFL